MYSLDCKMSLIHKRVKRLIYTIYVPVYIWLEFLWSNVLINMHTYHFLKPALCNIFIHSLTRSVAHLLFHSLTITRRHPHSHASMLSMSFSLFHFHSQTHTLTPTRARTCTHIHVQDFNTSVKTFNKPNWCIVGLSISICMNVYIQEHFMCMHICMYIYI